MKKQYSSLTLLTGILLVAGVVFGHFYDQLSTQVSVAASREQLAPDATAVIPENTGSSSATTGSSAVSAGTGSAQSSGSTGSTGSASAGSPSSGSVASNSSGYANGTYSSTISYRTPEGTENIGVTLAVANGIVTDVSVTNSGYNHDSVRYQNAFDSSYRSYVVGKSLASLRLSRVSGASLTTSAFNSALTQVRSEAAA